MKKKEKKFHFELPSWKLHRVSLPEIVLPKRWKLPRIVLPRRVVLPEIRMPRIRVDFPEEILVPWEQMEIERIEVMPLKPRDLKVIFRRIPVDERQIKQEATP